MKAKFVALLRPFHGFEVRRLTGFIMLGIALPRLPFWPGPAIVYPLKLLPEATFGWLTLAVSLALLITAWRWRLHFSGRFVALVAFVTWVILAVATTSVTSMILDITFAWASFGEVIAQPRAAAYDH